MPDPASQPFDLPINPAWEVHPTQVKSWLDQNEDFILLDVRQFKEWNFAKIQTATLLPLPELESHSPPTLELQKQKRIITYCHAGRRSLRAAALLRHYGFRSVHSMAGGIEAWSLLIDPKIPRY